MVLYHVTDGARLVVESAPALNAKILRQCHLYAFDIVAIPKRLENRVCEPEVENILNGPLPEVMVDTEYRFLLKLIGQDSIQLLSRDQVRSERLFDNDASGCSKARLFQLFDDRPELH